MKQPPTFPTKCLATCFIDEKEDIKIKHPGFFMEESQIAGPVPIDLPKIKISLSVIPTFLVKQLYTVSASKHTFLSEAEPL